MIHCLIPFGPDSTVNDEEQASHLANGGTQDTDLVTVQLRSSTPSDLSSLAVSEHDTHKTVVHADTDVTVSVFDTSA